MIPAELSALVSGNEMNIDQKIVEELLNQSNLDTKTELGKPLQWACLTLIQNFLKNKQMSISSTVLSEYVNICFKYLISKDRKGRLEYLDALKGIRQKEEILNPNSMNSGAIK